MNIAVSLDGVIRSLAGGTLIPEGKVLLELLRPYGAVVLLVDEPEAIAKRWLIQNRVFVDSIVDSSVDLQDSTPLRQRQVKVLSSKGKKIAFFVDHSPENIAWAMEEGITSLLFAHPKFALPKNMPGSPSARKSWGEIEKSYDKKYGLGKEEDAYF